MVVLLFKLKWLNQGVMIKLMKINAACSVLPINALNRP